MPYRKRTYKRKTKKRTYKRKRTSLRTLQGVPNGIPRVRTCKLRYNEVISISAPFGAVSTYTFRANSLYDPNSSGIGHQPMGFDTWATLYNHYQVIGSKITIRLIEDEATAIAAIAGVYLSDDIAAAYNSASGFIEAQRGTHAYVMPRTSKALVLRSSFSQRKFFNTTKNSPADRGTMGASVGQTPTEEAIFSIWLQSITSDTSTLYFDVTIDYIATFSEPKDLAQS